MATQNKQPEDKHAVHIELPKKVHSDLKKAADADRRSVRSTVAMLVERCLPDYMKEVGVAKP